MDSLVYNIPLSMARAYRGRDTVVRAHHPADLVAKLADEDLKQLSYIQLLTPGHEIDCLRRWEPPVPVDLVMRNPQADLPLLYQCTPLLSQRPIRVSISVVPGFGKAVRLAASLKLAVKLEVSQPNQALLEELLQVVDYYLHHSTVVQPIEFFHSLFVGFYRQERTTLWTIQEEDPALFRYVTETGEEALSERLAEVKLGKDGGSFVKRFKQKLMVEGAECCSCDFLDCCAGYFKLPRNEFSCDGVRILLQTLLEASAELRRDLAALPRKKGNLP